MIGELTLSNREKDRIEVMERLIRKEIKNSDAARLLGISTRQIKRIKKKYRMEGIIALAHKNRGKTSNNKIPESKINQALDIIESNYPDFGPTFALEKLEKYHGINFSAETLRKAMITKKLWKSKSRRKAHVHQPRLRRSSEGELIQLDGSEHRWFEDRGPMCTLIAYIDDATSKLLHCEFAGSESLWAYFNSFNKVLLNFGKPVALYSDKHTVFNVNCTKNGSAGPGDSHNPTQFGRAMKELNIELINANSPQAKGRIERSFGTLQDRLVKEMRLKGISNIEQANIYLPEFLEEFNQKFSVKPANTDSAYRKLQANEDLNKILTIKETRILSKNLTCQHNNITYLIQTNQSAYLLRKAKVVVSASQNGAVLITYKSKSLNYSIINKVEIRRPLSRKEVNQKVDEAITKNRKYYSPPLTHPLKQNSYQIMLMKKQLVNA